MDHSAKKKQTSIDRGHYHNYKYGKARTKKAIYYDELYKSDYGMHHHPITYKDGYPTIGDSEGHYHND